MLINFVVSVFFRRESRYLLHSACKSINIFSLCITPPLYLNYVVVWCQWCKSLVARKTSPKPVALENESICVFKSLEIICQYEESAEMFLKSKFEQEFSKPSQTFSSKQPFKLICRDESWRVLFMRDDSAISTAHI